MPSWLRDWSPIIPWLLVIVGWKVVSHDQNRRERRKEIRATIVQLISLIRQTSDTACDYWSKPEADPACLTLAADIKLSLQRVSWDVSRLTDECDAMNLGTSLIAFRQAITSGAFESADRDPDASRPPKIFLTGEHLIDSIETGFRKEFVDPKLRSWRLP